MSTARWGKKWADVDEEDEDDLIDSSPTKAGGARFETPPDENGIKTVVEYIERNGKTYKVTKHIKVSVTKKWTNAAINDRKHMTKFGKALSNDERTEASHVVRSEEDVNIEVSKKLASLTATNDAEDKFLEESLAFCESLEKKKQTWTDMNREKQLARDTDVTAPDDKKPSDIANPTPGEAAQPAAASGAPAPGRYVPPSLRGTLGKGGGKGDEKGGGKGGEEASLRITNLSEDVKEGDLQELFGQCGRLNRVFLGKDLATGQSKGFAFITYYNREDAQKAIKKLHGHGYDNLIMQVQWAKPRAA